MKIDVLIDGARILTQDPDRPLASRVAIHGGQILALDDECDGLEARTRVDAAGTVITPGFNDAHAHTVWFGTTLLELDLSGVANMDEVYHRIAERSPEIPAGEWLVASSYNQMDTGGQFPDADELDRASGGRPVWIKHTSGHSCIINRAAMTLLGVSGREVFDGGNVVTDSSGMPTGVLEETAMSLVQDVMLPLPEEDIVAALRAAHRQYVAEGLTSVTDAGIGGGWIGHSPTELGAYQRARADGALLVRTQVMLASDVLADYPLGGQTFHGLPGGMRSGFGDEWLSLGPVKIFLDGSILGNTAKMSGGYAHCPANHGYFQAEPELLHSRAVGAARAGWALAMHAVGDEAVDVALEILQEIATYTPPLPHRIEHGGVVTPEQLRRLGELGAPIVSQPHFMSVYGDGFREYLGDERVVWSFPGASQLGAGLPLAGSSDRPVAIGPPLRVMSSAIHRTTASGWVYGPDERLTPAQALASYTTGSAAVTGWARRKGRITPGHLADLVVLDDDPLENDPANLRVLSTVIGGRPVFDDAGPFAGRVDS